MAVWAHIKVFRQIYLKNTFINDITQCVLE